MVGIPSHTPVELNEKIQYFHPSPRVSLDSRLQCDDDIGTYVDVYPEEKIIPFTRCADTECATRQCPKTCPHRGVFLAQIFRVFTAFGQPCWIQPCTAVAYPRADFLLNQHSRRSVAVRFECRSVERVILSLGASKLSALPLCHPCTTNLIPISNVHPNPQWRSQDPHYLRVHFSRARRTLWSQVATSPASRTITTALPLSHPVTERSPWAI
ncbi:hypothetical protein B0H10DRAFT_524603 [Mycena sp. CBHHK59/15]|nr:hypothetical protein B0H10DRAFT_524603 [Mycena sp. CBHHK59/15]